MEVSSFTEIEAEFMECVHRMVWCNVATIDTSDRPRSRILHPLWEGATGWITTRRNLHNETTTRIVRGVSSAVQAVKPCLLNISKSIRASKGDERGKVV